ncbi:unnamed protein product [Boreogadus saida]
MSPVLSRQQSPDSDGEAAAAACVPVGSQAPTPHCLFESEDSSCEWSRARYEGVFLTLPGKFVSLCQMLLNVPHVLEARYLGEISVGRGAKGYVQSLVHARPCKAGLFN